MPLCWWLYDTVASKMVKSHILWQWWENNFSPWPLTRVQSGGSFWVLNPHENHMDPHFCWPWVQWTHYIDLIQAGSNFSYRYLEVLVSWWPQITLAEPFIFRKKVIIWENETSQKQHNEFLCKKKLWPTVGDKQKKSHFIQLIAKL